MREIMERIAKSLEFIADELKARRDDRQLLVQRISELEDALKGIQADPFGLRGKE